MADLTAADLRGQGFGLRLALAVSGFVVGPLIAIGLMRFSGDDFRLVFWIALLPACLSVVLLIVLVKELPIDPDDRERQFAMRLQDISLLPSCFWWAIAIAGGLSLARFSQAFILLKARDVGVESALVPAILAVTYLVFSTVAYPFGVLADRFDRRLQLGAGMAVLIAADLALASAGSIWLLVLGAVLWGLQLGITQGLLGAIIADIAPRRLRGTAFGIHDVATGLGVLIASVGVGVLWASYGPAFAFALSVLSAMAVGGLLVVGPYAFLVKR
jgi:MFS family permease